MAQTYVCKVAREDDSECWVITAFDAHGEEWSDVAYSYADMARITGELTEAGFRCVKR